MAETGGMEKNVTKFLTCLQQLSGDNANKKFPLKGSMVVIGRHPKSDIQVNSPGVSRTHCTLSCSRGKWTIKDNNSQNGTFVNSKFLEAGQVVPLSTADLIFLGPPIGNPVAFLFDQFVEEDELMPVDAEEAKAEDRVEAGEGGMSAASPSTGKEVAVKTQNDLGKSEPEKTPYDIQVEEVSSASQSLLDAESAEILAEESYPFSFKLDDSKQEPIPSSDKDCTALKTKLQLLSEEIQELQKSQSSLQQEYQVMCEKNKLLDEKLSEQQKLKEEMKMYEKNIKKQFKNKMMENLEEDLICNICTELLIKPTVLDCSHTFCEHCIQLWKKNKNQCPICRNPIKTQTRVLVLDQFIDKTLETLTPDQREKRRKLISEREASKSKPTPRTPSSGRGRRRAARYSHRQPRVWRRTPFPMVTAVSPATSNLVFSPPVPVSLAMPYSYSAAPVPSVSVSASVNSRNNQFIGSVAVALRPVATVSTSMNSRNRGINYQTVNHHNPVIEIIDLTRNSQMSRPMPSAQAMNIADILLSSGSDTE